MAKSAECLLVTATVGAVMMLVGSMSWPGVATLAHAFTRIVQALQVTP